MATPINSTTTNGNEAFHPLIPHLRAAARLLVREFGFMSSTFAGTNLPPSAVHALVEIGYTTQNPGVTAAGLCMELNLEKSSVSRMLRKLIEGDEIVEGTNGRDGREKVLSLTVKGKQTLEKIDELGNKQVQRAFDSLAKDASPEMVLKGIEAYANAMRTARVGKGVKKQSNVRILEGYRPGLAGRVIEMHMNYFSRFGFDALFEAMLSTGLGDLILRLDGIKANVWLAMDGDRIVGTIFIDTESKSLGDGSGLKQTTLGIAHLRMFLLDDSLQGKGFGRTMFQKAMDWVDERGLECQLWTFRDLVSARRLYDRAGFVVAEEESSGRLGKELWIQRFVRPGRYQGGKIYKP